MKISRKTKKTTIYPITRNNYELVSFYCSNQSNYNVDSVVIPSAYIQNCKINDNLKVFNCIDDAVLSSDHFLFLSHWDKECLFRPMCCLTNDSPELLLGYIQKIPYRTSKIFCNFK